MHAYEAIVQLYVVTDRVWARVDSKEKGRKHYENEKWLVYFIGGRPVVVDGPTPREESEGH